MSEYINITEENLAAEHLCCAISDKKHQAGVNVKRQWLAERIKERHVFRKLNEKGKVFIEYAPLETAWVPIVGDNYIHIYCLWVSGSLRERDMARHCWNTASRMRSVRGNPVSALSVPKRNRLF